MESKDWAVIPICIFIVGIIMFLAGSLWNTRRELDTTRAELIDTAEELQRAADTNRELGDKLAGVSTTIGELKQVTSTGADTVSECIRLVRNIREKVQELENSLYDLSSNSSNSRTSSRNASSLEINIL